MNDRTLNVLIDGSNAGVITHRAGGRHRFEYLDEWQRNRHATPLSYSLPLQQKRHGTRIVTNFMWGLLPDNENTLRRWGTKFKVSPTNPFAMLACVGEDCPGAVQIVPPDLDLKKRQRVKWISPTELEQRIVALKNDTGAGRLESDTGQFSLAGSQEKTALYRVNNRWGVPQGRTPTTHILKPETGRYLHIAANEHFCLQLARQCGLPAAFTEVQFIAGIPVIIVERFDRVRAGNLVRRVHQEDMCQVLGTREKYQQSGGPGIYEIMEMLQFSDRPELDRERFMRAQVFNYMIAGTDAHARNYSINYAPGGAFRLSPLYDVISDLPHMRNRRRRSTLAMTVGGERNIRQITHRHWERQARSVHYPRDKLFAHLRDLIARSPAASAEVRRSCSEQGLKSPVIDILVEEIDARCKLLNRLYGAEFAKAAA